MFFCKQFLALFLWCHCYQIVLNPFLHLLAIGLTSSRSSSSSSSSFGAGGALYVAGSPITAAANKVTLTPGQEIALSCKIAEHPEANFIWFKQRKYPIKDSQSGQIDEEKREINKTDDRYIISSNSIIIKSSNLADVGDYTCQVKDDIDVDVKEKMISVRPKPFILDFNLEESTPRSANVQEGKKLKIPCNVIDDYFSDDQIHLTWHMSKYDESDMNDVHGGEDGIEIKVNNRTSQELIIDNVTKDHRRLYKCQVSNGITENSKSILIRVKDKYTAIWPAVGIVIELVILIGVICVVENRKIEPDKEVYDRKAIQM